MQSVKMSIVAGATVAGLLLSGCGTAAVEPAQADEPSSIQLQQEVGDEAEDRAEGEDVPITGDALDRASAAALDYIGEGRVTDTEVGDEEGFYEVEITLENGQEVDVHLDENFVVLGQEAEGQADED